MKLKAGRFLDSKSATDLSENIIVNEEFMSTLGLSFPLEEAIVLDSIAYQIVGVVVDFHTEFFQRPMVPTVIRATEDSAYDFLTLQMSTGSASSSMELVKGSFREVFPLGLFEGKLQADVFEFSFNDVRGVQNIILFSAILAVLLSAMGLFGLVSLNMSSRIKDFCIRKVFGAALGDLSKKLFKRYLISWGIASILGGVVSFLIVSAFLDSFFAFHSGVGLLPLASGILGLLLVIGVTVSSQLWKVHKANPSYILKSE
jgi:ABC-type antimicrobial peptide transport system permease subunit